MHKAQRGQKLSVVRKVLTTLNFLTTLSFSVTMLSCDPVLTILNFLTMLSFSVTTPSCKPILQEGSGVTVILTLAKKNHV